MAIRYRKEYGTWQVYWNNPITGKRESKSFTDQKEAEKENSLVIHRLKYEPESFKVPECELEAQTATTRTLEQVYLEYLCEKKFSKTELAAHRAHMQRALEVLGSKTVSEVTHDDLESVKKLYISDPKLKQATVHKRLSVLKTLIFYAVDKGYMEPIRFPTIPNPNYEKFIPPSREELTAMFSVAPPHIKRVIIIGAFCGARVGQCELLQLTWADVDLQNCLIRIHGSKKNEHAPWREVPIKQAIVPLFETWREEDLAQGISNLITFNGQPVHSIKTAWRTCLKHAGINRRIRPYDLRHAFGTELVANGADIGTIAKLMGHSSPAMLLNHYQYVMDSQKINAVEKLPDLPHVPRSCAAKNSN